MEKCKNKEHLQQIFTCFIEKLAIFKEILSILLTIICNSSLQFSLFCWTMKRNLHIYSKIHLKMWKTATITQNVVYFMVKCKTKEHLRQILSIDA